MKLKQTVKRYVVAGVMVLFLALGAVVMTTAAPVVQAACDPATQNCCGGTPTSVIACDQDGSAGVENSGVWGILVLAINILTGLVGLVAIIGIIMAAIMYTTAGGSEEQLKKAKGILMNVVIGIVVFAFLFPLVNFLIPGGIFR